MTGRRAGATLPRHSGKDHRRWSSSIRRAPWRPIPTSSSPASSSARARHCCSRFGCRRLYGLDSAIERLRRSGASRGGMPIRCAASNAPEPLSPSSVSSCTAPPGMRGLPTALVSMPREWRSWWKVGPGPLWCMAEDDPLDAGGSIARRRRPRSQGVSKKPERTHRCSSVVAPRSSRLCPGATRRGRRARHASAPPHQRVHPREETGGAAIPVGRQELHGHARGLARPQLKARTVSRPSVVEPGIWGHSRAPSRAIRGMTSSIAAGQHDRTPRRGRFDLEPPQHGHQPRMSPPRSR